MNKKKWMILALIIISLVLSANLIEALRQNQSTGNLISSTYDISPDSNFFSQPENQALVSLPDDYQGELLSKGFRFVADTNDLALYVKSSVFNIAIYDKNSGYLWYSVYPDYNKYFLSGTSRYFVESGVVIEYYNMNNILIDDAKSYLSGPKYNVECTYDFDSLENGLIAHLEFEDLAISFDVHVSIFEDQLNVTLPIDSLVEEDVEKLVLNLDGSTSTEITQYRLKSVYIFPYFGSNNFEINGYSMIPDGSGALIRYTDNRSSTAYTKRLYGSDEGVLKYTDNESTYYLQDELTASAPIFGVNHGYKQAAFLAVITEGDAFTEIHSYPYGYNSYEMNTTFAKFIIRERYTIKTSSNESDSFQMINEEPYPTDYSITYHFLSNEEASYTGMAVKYRNLLNFEKQSDEPNVNITLIGMDYKNGLLGKNYVEMTTYQDVIDIIDDLSEEALENISIVYQAWNKGGYYDNASSKPVIASNLGGKQDFLAMLEVLNEKHIDITLLSNPIISYNQNLGSGVVRKLTLSTFITDDVTTSLFNTTYFRNPEQISERILDYNNFYNTYNLNSFIFDSVGDNLFSYRYDSKDHYRNQSIEILQNELLELTDYHISLYEPNAYLWPYIDAYYDMPIESNKYSYITDSIPFIEIVLSGHVNMYSNYVNYFSDYELLQLRMIEYGVNPSFLITKESTHLLRYTNSEFIYTSQYDLWKETMIRVGKGVIEALDPFTGISIINHRYVDEGVAEVTYENGLVLYVNYTNQDKTIGSTTIDSHGFEVIQT